MNDEFMVFVVMVTLVSGGLFLIFIKMILNFFRDRRRGQGASMGTGELEALIQRAVEAGTASLHDRLDDLEERLEEVPDNVEAWPKALPQPSSGIQEVIEQVEPVAVSESRRSRQ